MRTQKKAFTLAELSIVVAIIAIIAVILSSIDFSSQSNTEKRDRIISKISDTIRSTRTISTTGRTSSWVIAGKICSDYSILLSSGAIRTSFSQISDTGSIIDTCGADADHSLSPLFDEKGYSIKYISWADIGGNNTFCMGDCGGSTTADQVKLLVKSGQLFVRPILSGVENTTVWASTITLEIRAGFNEPLGVHDPMRGRNILLDLRTGKIDIMKP